MYCNICCLNFYYKALEKKVVVYNIKISANKRIQTDFTRRSFVAQCGTADASVRLVYKKRDEKTINSIGLILNGVCWNS